MSSRLLAIFALALAISCTGAPASAQKIQPDKWDPESTPPSNRSQINRQFRERNIRTVGRGAMNIDSRRSIDGSSELTRLNKNKDLADNSRLASQQITVPFWSAAFTYQGLEFEYKMVGTNPTKGPATTVIPTVIVPLRFVFPDGQVFDSATDLVDGQTAIQGIVDSPIFQNYNFVIGGTLVGNTQYGDAFQRANFWDAVSARSRNYHVLLGQPTVAPTQTIIVPAGMGSYYYEPSLDLVVPIVNSGFLYEQSRAIHAALQISPRTLPILVWGKIVSESTFAPGFAGAYAWHGAYDVEGGIQTYIGTSYQAHSPIDPRTDVYSLSHEILEWMNDPFTDNFSPGWNVPFIPPVERCDSGSMAGGRLEVADPVEFFLESGVELPGPTFNYHVAEGMFIDFFTRSARSRSVNGQYSMFEIGSPFGIPTEPSSECIGSVQADQRFVDVPNSRWTEARGLNNKGEVVGFFVDQQNRRRGFLWKAGNIRILDFPGSRGTIPYKINFWGDIVGYYFDSDGLPQGFLLTNGKWERLDFPGSVDGVALGINSLGEVVGAFDDEQFTTHGYKFSNGTFTTFDAASEQGTELTGNNDLGQFVGFGWTDPVAGPYFGFQSSGGGISSLNMPGAQFSQPYALNNKNSAVGIFDNGDGYSSGFVRVFGYLHEVNADGVVTYVYGNNDLNQLVGTTYDFNTQRWVGFIGTMPIAKNVR